MDSRLKFSYLVFALVAAALISGVTIYSIWTEYRMTMDRERESLVRTCDLVTEETSQLFSRVDFMLETIDQWLLANPACDPRFDPAFNHLVESFRISTDHKIDIRLVSGEGGLYYIPSKDRKPLADVKDREYFREQMNGTARGLFIASPVKSRVTGIWGIPISRKLNSANAGMAVVFAAIDLPVLNVLYDSARPKPEGTVALYTTEGKLLAISPFDETLLTGSYTGFMKIQEMEDKDGLFTVKSSTEDPQDRLYAHRSIPRYGLEVLVSGSSRSLLAGWQVSTLFHTGITLVIFLSLMLFCLFVYRLLSRLTQKSKDLEEANGFKDQIFSLLSHDLRAPLGSMINFFDFLEERMDALDDKERRNALTMLKQSGRNIQNLLDNLLSWLKLTREMVKCKPENLDPAEAIQETIAIFDISMSQKGVSLKTDVSPRLRLHADPEMFKGILRNLISNALKATRQNSELLIQAEQDAAGVVFRIRDQGYGMSREQLDTLTVGLGTTDLRSGLGLMLVRDFVSAHKGKIWAESTEGVGSTFNILFPAPAPEEADQA